MRLTAIATRVVEGLARSRVLSAVLFLALLWILAVFLAPLSLPPGSLRLAADGGANRLDNTAAYDDLHPLVHGTYLVGDIECHQRPERSLLLNGNQMPLCVRCTGIFLFAVPGLLAAAGARPDRSLSRTLLNVLPAAWRDWLERRVGAPVAAFLLVAAFVAPAALDGFSQLPGWRESTNVLRAITGGLAGVGGGLLVGALITSTREAGRPRTPKARAPF